jgi:hypothetical protein
MSSDEEKLKLLLKSLMNRSNSKFNSGIVNNIQKVINDNSVSDENKMRNIDLLLFSITTDDSYDFPLPGFDEFKILFEQEKAEADAKTREEERARASRPIPTAPYASKEAAFSSIYYNARGLKNKKSRKSKKNKKSKKVKTSKKKQKKQKGQKNKETK